MKRLEKITKLRNCTLHGNPIAKVANYRLYILGKVVDWVMFHRNAALFAEIGFCACDEKGKGKCVCVECQILREN